MDHVLAGGKPVAIGGDETFQDGPTWSPKGDWIAYLVSADARNAQAGLVLVKTPVGVRAPAVPLYKGIPPFVARPQWSPDGDWILCETFEGLRLIPADGLRAPRVISEGQWFAYAWDKDGRRIYGLRATDDLHHFMLVSLDPKTRRRAHHQQQPGRDSAGAAADPGLQPAAQRRIPDVNRQGQV